MAESKSIVVSTDDAPQTHIMRRTDPEGIRSPIAMCVLSCLPLPCALTDCRPGRCGLKDTLLCPLCCPWGYVNQVLQPCALASCGNCITLLTCDQVCCGCTKYGKIDCVFPPCLTSVGCLPALACHPLCPCTIPLTGCCCTSWAPAPAVAAANGQLKKGDTMELFKDGISPLDITQGAVGDCWLLATFSAAAEQPKIIQHCFIEKEAQQSGLYHVRLFDGPSQSWRTVAVDHRIPKVAGQHLSTTPNGAELWVGLLEKACAKFRGSYAGMDGGYPAWALEALTGQPAQRFVRDEYVKGGVSKWSEHRVQYLASGSRQRNGFRPTGLTVDDGATGMWERLLYWEKKNYLMTAGCAKDKNGLLSGHAYTVLAAYQVGEHKIVKLRNPHGSRGSEWTGAWSDTSDLWKKNPAAAVVCGIDLDAGAEAIKDGVFCMPVDDFLDHFVSVTVVNPKVESLPSNAQVAGNIGAACADQMFTLKRFTLDSWRYICCCAGLIQFHPFGSECLAGCGPCFKPCWARRAVYTTGR